MVEPLQMHLKLLFRDLSKPLRIVLLRWLGSRFGGWLLSCFDKPAIVICHHPMQPLLGLWVPEAKGFETHSAREIVKRRAHKQGIALGCLSIDEWVLQETCIGSIVEHALTSFPITLGMQQ